MNEYWTVDPDEKDVQAFVLGNGRYFMKGYGTDEGKMTVDVLEDREIDLAAKQQETIDLSVQLANCKEVLFILRFRNRTIILLSRSS